MQYLKSKELAKIRQLKKECKFKEALNIINKIENEKDLSLQDKFEIHYLKSTLLLEVGNCDEALKYTDLAYKDNQKIGNKFQIIDILNTKITALNRSGRNKEAFKTIKKAEKILNTIDQSLPLEFKEKKAHLDLQKGNYYWNIGDLNRSLKHTDEGLTIAKEIKNKKLILLGTRLVNFNYYMKGELDRAFELIKRTLALAKEIDDKQTIITALNGMGMYFTDKGDFQQALDYLEQALSLCDKIDSWKTHAVLSSLFVLYLYTNSLEKAQQCLDRMKLHKDREGLKFTEIFYLLSKAQILKRKPQYINHLKAKKILKQIVDVEKPFTGLLYPALIELCDLILSELRDTNNIKILDEVQSYITQLMKIAEKQQSFWLQVEVYSLKARLKLITFEFETAQNFLKQAFDIAEKYGLNVLADRIIKEQEELVNQESEWDALRKSNATMAERMELALVDEQLGRMLRKRVYF